MYSNNNFNSFGSSDRYGFENKWDKLQKDIAERMKDPFMIKELLQNITTAWRRYLRFRDEFDRDVTALMDISSSWRKDSISLNTNRAVYGDDTRAVIRRMNSGKITPREDVVDLAIEVKNYVSLARRFRPVESPEDLIDITALLDDAVDQLIRDNARLIENMLFGVREAVAIAEKYLEKYDGFTFRYNVSSLGFSIDIRAPKNLCKSE